MGCSDEYRNLTWGCNTGNVDAVAACEALGRQVIASL